MKYSKSDSEYFRNKKGGGLQTNGKLNAANFSRNKKNGELNKNKFSIISNENIDRKLGEINPRKNKNTFELPEMNSSGKYKIKPIKIMVKKKSGFNKLYDDEHYIFFGFDPETSIYEYVCYVNKDFGKFSMNGSPIICKKREKNGTIVDISHHQFLDINIKELSILVYHLLLIDQKSNKLLDQIFFKYLLDFVLPKIINTYKTVNNDNLHDIVGKIKKIMDIPNNTNNLALLP